MKPRNLAVGLFISAIAFPLGSVGSDADECRQGWHPRIVYEQGSIWEYAGVGTPDVRHGYEFQNEAGETAILWVVITEQPAKPIKVDGPAEDIEGFVYWEKTGKKELVIQWDDGNSQITIRPKSAFGLEIADSLEMFTKQQVARDSSYTLDANLRLCVDFLKGKF